MTTNAYNQRQRRFALQRRRGGLAAALMVGALIAIRLVAPGESFLRYVIYAMPLAALASQTVADSFSVNTRYVVALAAYCAVFGMANLIGADLGQRALENFAFIAIPLITIALLPRLSHDGFRIVASFVAAAFIIEVSTTGDLGVGPLLSLASSYSAFESSAAFPAGVLFVYFIKKRDWFYGAVMAVVVILAFKRIVFLGVAVAFIYDALSAPLPVRQRLSLAVSIFLGIAVAALSASTIVSWAFKTWHIRLPIEVLLMGRFGLYSAVDSFIAQQSLLVQLFGSGAGTAETVGGTQRGVQYYLIHNDFKMFLTDYGYVGMSILCAGLIILLKSSQVGRMTLLMVAVLMATDNVTIYNFFTIVVLMLATSSMLDERPESASRPPGRLRRWHGRGLDAR